MVGCGELRGVLLGVGPAWEVEGGVFRREQMFEGVGVAGLVGWLNGGRG